MILTAANSYSGGTTITAGTLQIGNGGTDGSIAGDVIDNGTLAFNRSDDMTFAGLISGTGTISQIGAGTTVLTGTNRYSGGSLISAGTLMGTASSFGMGAIQDEAALAIDQPSDAIFANAINGGGGFTKLGAGRLSYTGTGTLSGLTNIAAGTLAVNGALANSAVTVQSGGALGGNGTVGAVDVLAGGTVAPGNSIGTLTVNGTFAQTAGSTYQVEVDPNSNAADLIQVKDAATITSGADLNVTKTSAGDYHAGTVYTVLTAGNGVSGTYDLGGETTSVSSFLALKDTYDANTVYLTVMQTRSIDDLTGTPNEVATGHGLNPLPGSNPITTAVLNLPTDDDARSALDKLSGDGLASIKSIMMTDGRYVRAAALGRARAMFCVTGSAYSLDDGTESDRQPAGGCLSAPTRPVIWAQGYGAWGGIGSDGNAAGLSHATAGFLVGVDVPVWGWRAGVFGGRSATGYGVVAHNVSTESTDYHLGTYAGHQWGPLGFSLGASYSWDAIDGIRSVAFGNFSNMLKGTYNAGTTQVFAELSYRLNAWTMDFEPFANLAAVNLRTGGFTETGGDAALTSIGGTMDNVVSIFGVRPSSQIDLGPVSATLKGMLGWQHTYGDVLPTSTFSFAGGDPFSIAGVPIARDAAAIEGGFDVNLTGQASFGIVYGGRFAGKVTDQSVRGTLRIDL